MGQKYPLAALSTQRTAAAEQRAQALALAEATRLAVLDALTHAQQALDGAREALRRSETVASERLAAGVERVFDLKLAADERRAQLARIDALEVDVRRAQAEFARAEKLRDEARGALALAQAEQRAVEAHHDEWQRRAALVREEQQGEEALEQWTSEHVRSGQK